MTPIVLKSDRGFVLEWGRSVEVMNVLGDLLEKVARSRRVEESGHSCARKLIPSSYRSPYSEERPMACKYAGCAAVEPSKAIIWYTQAELEELRAERRTLYSEWIETLTPGTVINCYYNGSRKTIVLGWRKSLSCSSGYQIKAKHNRQWLDSFWFKASKTQTLPISITRPRVD